MSAVNDIVIVMPLGGLSPWFDQAIESALLQSTRVRIRLIANGLKVEELDRLRDLESLNDRILLHEFEERTPLVENWNRIFDVAVEKFVCVLHDDDILEPWAIEELIKVAALFPGQGIYHGRERIIDEDGKFYHDEVLSRVGKTILLTQDDIFNWAISNRIRATGFLMNVDLAKECGCYNNRSSYCPDWDLYFLLASKFGACFTDVHIGRYRLSKKSGQGSVAFAKDGRNLKESEIQQFHNLRALGLDPHTFSRQQKVSLAHTARTTIFYFGSLMSDEGRSVARNILIEGLVAGRFDILRRIFGEKVASIASKLLIWWRYPILRT